jgi:hypothetical protein
MNFEISAEFMPRNPSMYHKPIKGNLGIIYKPGKLPFSNHVHNLPEGSTVSRDGKSTAIGIPGLDKG